MKGKLVLENGSVFEGDLISAKKECIGGVILHTEVVGYQEIMTDPANAGKIIVFTYPLIGNYGVSKKFYESKKAWVAGFVIKEKSKTYSNWQAEGSLDDFIKKEKLTCLNGCDTRTIAITIRDHGEMLGIITARTTSTKSALKKLASYKKKPQRDFIKDISVEKITKLKTEKGRTVAILDLGVSKGTIDQLETLGCTVILLPYNTDPKEIFAMKPDGLIISDGPEEDSAIPDIVKRVKVLIGKVPMLGISLGHSVVASAMGGKLRKLTLGHRGVNYPVISASSYKGEITVQNHSYVLEKGIERKCRDLKVTLRNVNDKTIERIESKKLKLLSVQYSTKSPGSGEVNEVLETFVKGIAKGKRKK